MSVKIDQSKPWYALIMAGGSGTRLWPLSRKATPKQFQRLAGEKTLFQHMVQLTTQVIPLERVYVMAIPQFKQTILEQVPDLPEENILLEPALRDNGPAIALGMMQIALIDPEAVVANLWSDHVNLKPAVFADALEASFEMASSHPSTLVTIGAKPTHPDTGLGYIQTGKQLGAFGNDVPVFKADSFVEKPDEEKAQEFVESGKYLWNVGYKIMGVRQFIKDLTRVKPELDPIIKELQDALTHKDDQKLASGYDKLPKLSIEYLYTQYVKDIAVVPADMGWSDVGSWKTLHQVMSADQEVDVVTEGPVHLVDSRNCLVFAGSGKPIAVVGMEDVVVVETEDAILVMRKEAAAKVKDLTNLLSTTNPDLL